MLFSVSSDESRIRHIWLDYEAKIAALNGKPAPAVLDVEQFRPITEGLNTYAAEKAARLYARFVQNDLSLPDARDSSGLGFAFRSGFFNDARLRYVPTRQRQSVNTFAVVANGKYLPKEKLQEMLRSIERR